MDSPHCGSLYVHAHEGIVRGNDTLLFLRFREPIDAQRIGASWEKQVRGRPTLQLRWTPELRWEPIPPKELDAAIAEGRRALAAIAGPAELGGYRPSGIGLPYRLLRSDATTLLCRASHLLTNGLGQLFWLEDLLRIDARGEAGALPDESLAPPPTWFARASEPLLAARALLFALRFGRAAGRHAGRETADPTRGRVVDGHRRGTTIRRYAFTVEASERLRDASRARGLTVTGAITAAAARALFEAEPSARRVLVGLPVDLGADLPHRSRALPGNPTAGHVVQLFREGDVDAQARAGLAAVRRRIPYGLARLSDAPASDERKVLAAFAHKVRLPMPQRAPFENCSALVSSLRCPDAFTELGRRCTRASLHTFTQAPFLSALTLGGATTLAITSPDDLVEPEEAAALADRIARELDPKAGFESDTLRLEP